MQFLGTRFRRAFGSFYFGNILRVKLLLIIFGTDNVCTWHGPGRKFTHPVCLSPPFIGSRMSHGYGAIRSTDGPRVPSVSAFQHRESPEVPYRITQAAALDVPGRHAPILVPSHPNAHSLVELSQKRTHSCSFLPPRSWDRTPQLGAGLFTARYSHNLGFFFYPHYPPHAFASLNTSHHLGPCAPEQTVVSHPREVGIPLYAHDGLSIGI